MSACTQPWLSPVAQGYVRRDAAHYHPRAPLKIDPTQRTAVLTRAEEGGFVTLNPETCTNTQGESTEEALANLREATELYLEEFPGAPFCIATA